jgi:hypothetical protein
MFAPVVVLLFLGTCLLVGAGLLIAVVGALRGARGLLRAGAGGAAIVVAGYLSILIATSLASKEKVLPPGSLKYFCEVDCHLAYSVVGVQTSSAFGPEMRQTTAKGQFVIVRVRTWFDETTISPRRGNALLTPNGRRVTLVDDRGRIFERSRVAEYVADRAGGTRSAPLTESLRPGESYETDLAFDVPQDAKGLRLLIAESAPQTQLIIGHENSWWHPKVYLRVDGAPKLAQASR